MREGRNKGRLGLLSCPDRASSGGEHAREVRKRCLDISTATCFWDRQKKARELQKPKAVCGRLGRKVSDGGGSRQRLLEREAGV